MRSRALKKTLSVLLAAMLTLSVFSGAFTVFAAIEGVPTRADVDSYFSDPTLYGAEKWDKTTDIATLTFNWDAYSGSLGYDPQPGKLTFTYPSHIYLNVGETLEGAGYMGHMTASYGENDGSDVTDFRVLLSSATWGESTRTGFSDVIGSLISGYGHQGTCTEGSKIMTGSSSHYDFANDGRGSDQIFKNKTSENENFESDKESVVVWRSNIQWTDADMNNFDEYVLLTGTASNAGEVTFNPTGNFTIGAAQRYTSFAWHTDNGCRLNRSLFGNSGRPETAPAEGALSITFTVYDKSELNSLITAADNGNYTLQEGQTQEQFNAALADAKAVRANREVSQEEIDAAAAAIGDKMTLLVNANEGDYRADASVSKDDAVFNKTVYHFADEATEAYRNVVYAPAASTVEGEATSYIQFKYDNCYYRVYMPTSTVLVYYLEGEENEPISPIMMGHVGDNRNNCRAIYYYANATENTKLPLQNFWVGYKDGSNDNRNYLTDADKVWANSGSNSVYINGTVVNSGFAMSDNQGNKSTWRNYWNYFRYTGSGDTSAYYEKFDSSNINMSLRHKWNATIGSDDDTYYSNDHDEMKLPGTVYVLNYKPIYDNLDTAAAVKAEMEGPNGWMYTEASVKRVKATIAAMLKANPNNFAYAGDVNNQVIACAGAIADAKYMIDHGGLTLEKKQGTVTFVSQTGETLAINGQPATYTKEYGESIAANEIPQLSNAYYRADNAQWDYGTELTWFPAIEGSTILVDAPEKIYQINDTQTVQTYTVTFYDEDGATALVSADWQYGDYPDYGGTVIKAKGDEATVAAPTKASTATQHFTFYHWVDTDGAEYGLNDMLKPFTVTDVTNSTRADLDTDAMKKYTAVYAPADHTFGTPVYTWADDHSTCTAARTCTAEGCGYVETETVNAQSSVDPAATCSAAGTRTFSATFTNTAFEAKTATEEVAIDENAHKYVFDSFVWSTEGTVTAKAQYKCEYSSDHTALYNAEVTYEYTGATCTDQAKTVHTAVYDGHTDTYTVYGEAATGHTYAEPAAADWTWMPDGDTYTVTVTVSCTKNDDTQILTAVVSAPTVVNATHLENGSKTFTATATVGTQTFSAQKVDVITAEGHTWVHHDAAVGVDCKHNGTVEYWSCTGCDELRAADQETVITDTDDNTPGAHTYGELHAAVPATCAAQGNIAYYQCSVCNKYFDADKNEIESVTVDVNENAHNWGEKVLTSRPVYNAETETWSKGEYTYTCRNNAAHTRTEEVDRADYAAFDSLKAELLSLAEGDYTDAIAAEINAALQQLNAIAQDYVAPEQDALDTLVAAVATVKTEIGNEIETAGEDAFKHYTVAFVNSDNTALQSLTLKKGDAVIYTADTPVCPENNAQYTYAFLGWRAEIDGSTVEYLNGAALPTVTGSITYTAFYDEEGSVNSYTVTWVNAGDPTTTEVAYGDTPAHDLPFKADDTYYTYGYSWSPVIAPVTADATYTAVESKTWNAATQQLIDNAGTLAADPDNAYDDDYTDELNNKLADINDETKPDSEREAAVESLRDLMDEADRHKYYTVSFVTDGSAVESIRELYNTAVSLPASSLDGSHFEGWFTDESRAAAVALNDENKYVVTADVTLYAKFNALSLDPSDVADEIKGIISSVTDGEGNLLYGDCYTAASLAAYNDAKAAAAAFSGMPATAQNLADYETALETLDAAVKALTPEHAWKDWAVINNPTVTAEGLARRECANNDSHTEEKTMAKITAENVTPPTETEPGQIVIDPEGDIDPVVIPVLNDTDYTVTAQAGNCTETGSKTYTWKGNDTYGVNVVVTVDTGLVTDAHDYGAWIVDVYPTASEAGRAYRVCSRNDAHVDEKTLAKITADNVTLPTETQPGQIAVDPDGEIEPIVIPTLNDTDYTVSEQAGNCTETGSKTYTWKGNDTYGTNVVVTVDTGLVTDAHDYGAWIVDVYPTASEAGRAYRVCSRNDAHVDEKTLAKITADNVTLPTETQPGQIAVDPDGEIEPIVIPVLNDTDYTVSEQAGNCTVNGSKTYTWKGNDTYGTNVVVTVDTGLVADAHAYGAWTVSVTPTLITEGTATCVCGNNAAHVLTKTLKKLTADDITGVTEPTDTEDGRLTVTVKDENDTVIDTVEITIPAYNTKDYTLTNTVPGNCTEEGCKTYAWKGNAAYGLNVTYTVNTGKDADAHDWGEWIVDVPADYGVDGHAHRTCARCGATENKTLTIGAEYDRQIKFYVIPKMHYVIEVGDGFAVFNTNTILWYSAAELHFHVYTYTNSGYGDNYTVYINGKAATPDANGSYTLPAGSTSDTVSISVNSTVTPSQPGSGHDGSSSGTCAYCGKVHSNNLWGRIVALFHAIFAFFRDLFKR